MFKSNIVYTGESPFNKNIEGTGPTYWQVATQLCLVMAPPGHFEAGPIHFIFNAH